MCDSNEYHSKIIVVDNDIETNSNLIVDPTSDLRLRNNDDDCDSEQSWKVVALHYFVSLAIYLELFETNKELVTMSLPYKTWL